MRCAVCGSPAVTWHHVIPQQRLRWEFGKKEGKRLSKDERNRVWLCWLDHANLEAKTFYIPKDDLPSSVMEFARDTGLEWWMETYYGEARAS